MPLGRQLVGVTDPEEQVFLEMRAHKLHPDRQPLRVKTDRGRPAPALRPG